MQARGGSRWQPGTYPISLSEYIAYALRTSTRLWWSGPPAWKMRRSRHVLSSTSLRIASNQAAHRSSSMVPLPALTLFRSLEGPVQGSLVGSSVQDLQVVPDGLAPNHTSAAGAMPRHHRSPGPPPPEWPDPPRKMRGFPDLHQAVRSCVGTLSARASEPHGDVRPPSSEPSSLLVLPSGDASPRRDLSAAAMTDASRDSTASFSLEIGSGSIMILVLRKRRQLSQGRLDAGFLLVVVGRLPLRYRGTRT